MIPNVPEPDPPLSEEQRANSDRLTDLELREIDETLLSCACNRWRKVARVVGTAMGRIPNRKPGVPDLFYAERVRLLVRRGQLEADGDLAYMGRSEVRLPAGSEERVDA